MQPRARWRDDRAGADDHHREATGRRSSRRLDAMPHHRRMARDHGEEEVLEDTKSWLRTQPPEVQALLLDPYTLKTYAPIAKCRCEVRTVEHAAFRIQKAVKEEERSEAPLWAAVERSPAAGLRRRTIQLFPMLDPGSGAIYSGGKGAARHNTDTKKRERKPGWNSTAVTRERFESDTEKRPSLVPLSGRVIAKRDRYYCWDIGL